MESEKNYLIEEIEWIKESGEIPEVAFYETLSYLTKNIKGPKLKLTSSDISLLEDAVIYRYKTIIFRDLNYSSISTPVFRGIKRAIINYKRLKKYQQQKHIKNHNWEKEISGLLIEYMDQECRDISEKRFYRTINCSQKELEEFAKEIGTNIDQACLDICFKQIPLTFDEVYKITLIIKRHDYPYKFLFDRGNYFEIAIFNKNRCQFPVSLKINIDETIKKHDIQLKADAVYRSIPKPAPPWDIP